MQSYGQKAQRRAVKEAVREEMHRYAEHFDLCVLMTLRRYGYGAKRLREFYEDFAATYEDFKRRYYDRDDERIFGERGDTYEMKKALLEIGFDYEAEVKRLNEKKEAEGCQG